MTCCIGQIWLLYDVLCGSDMATVLRVVCVRYGYCMTCCVGQIWLLYDVLYGSDMATV